MDNIYINDYIEYTANPKQKENSKWVIEELNEDENGYKTIQFKPTMNNSYYELLGIINKLDEKKNKKKGWFFKKLLNNH